MKRIISFLMIVGIAILGVSTTAEAVTPQKKAKARTTTTARKSSTASSATIQWIDGELPSPKALCEYYFDGKGSAQMEKALKSKGYVKSEDGWNKEMTAYVHFLPGNRICSLEIEIIPADLYTHYLQAAKTYCNSKNYTLDEDKASGVISISNM